MMAHPSIPARLPAPARVGWRRARQRRWARPSDVPSATRLLAIMPSLPRAALARLTACMIDRMDEIDGDPDLEDLRDDDEDGHDQEQEQAYD